MIEELLEKPYWVVDLLPVQVPADAPGQYFSVEEYYLQPERIRLLHGKFADILLKLNCYFDFRVCYDAEERWEENPDPETLAAKFAEDGEAWTLYFFLPSEQALIMVNSDDLYMTVYGPTARLMEILRQLAQSEGLFMWKPE